MKFITIHTEGHMKLFLYSILVFCLSVFVNINAHTKVYQKETREKKSTISPVNEYRNKIVDSEGIVKVIADQTGEFSEGLCPFMRDNKWGFMDTQGTIVVEPKYLCNMDIPVFKNGVARVYDPSVKAWGYIGHDGSVAIPFKFYSCTDFENGFALSYKPGSASDAKTFAHIQIITKLGIIPVEVAPCRYSYSTVFKEGMARISQKSGYGYMNVLGMVIGNSDYDDVRDFSDSLAAVQKDGKWGFIDKTGTLVIPFMFTNEPGAFSSDRAFVMGSNYLYGIIDKSGKIIVEPKYKQVFPFENGFAVVSTTDQKYQETFYIIDTNGKVIKDFPKPKKDNDKIAFFSGFIDGLTIVQKGYSMERGFMDTKGKMMTGFDFIKLVSIHDGLAYAEKFDTKSRTQTKGFINKNGKWVIQIEIAKF
jgi:hypothetical protein